MKYLLQSAATVETRAAHRKGVASVATERFELILCRCENVTAAEVERAVAEHGARTGDQIKKLTRAGMGPCQGRTCLALAARWLAEHQGRPLEEITWPAARPPVMPVPLGVLAGGDEPVD
jgi:NAD(P)H-nitrite reductase large subunit